MKVQRAAHVGKFKDRDTDVLTECINNLIGKFASLIMASLAGQKHRHSPLPFEKNLT